MHNKDLHQDKLNVIQDNLMSSSVAHQDKVPLALVIQDSVKTPYETLEYHKNPLTIFATKVTKSWTTTFFLFIMALMIKALALVSLSPAIPRL